MKLNIQHDFDRLAKAMENASKQARFAAAVALTRTGRDIRQAIPAELDRVLDKPTEFTKRGTYLVAARRDNLVAEIGFRPLQSRYMRYQVEGGVYQPKEGGIKLPGNITLNAFGNIPRGTINRLKAAAKNGSLGATVARRIGANGDRRKGAAPIQLFYGQPTGKGWEKAPVGIWRRIPPATPGAKGKLIPVIVFEKTPARYSARFEFKALALKVRDQRFATHFDTALRQALASAR